MDEDPESLQQIAFQIRDAGYAVENYRSEKELLRALKTHLAFCVVIDVDTLVMPGLQTGTFSEIFHLPIIFVGKRVPFSIGVEVMKRGAVDVLHKPLDGERLIAAIKVAAEKYKEAKDLASAFGRFHLLTQREREVFELVTSGLLNKQIAFGLGIAEKTIKVHRSRIMKKFGFQSIVELVRLHDKLAIFNPAAGWLKSFQFSQGAKVQMQNISPMSVEGRRNGKQY